MGEAPHGVYDPRWMTLPGQIAGSRRRDCRVVSWICWGVGDGDVQRFDAGKWGNKGRK